MSTYSIIMSENDYGADNIQELEGLDAVRKRPGMYIGTTSERGLHHMVREVVDNGVDEAMAGHADQIDVKIHGDGSVSVEDNGRGIPVEEKDGEPVVNVIMTSIHAGGKFDSDAYEVSGGLHGVGVSVVNALSVKLETIIKRDGQVYRQVFNDGIPQGLETLRGLEEDEDSGSMVRFWPDGDAFETLEFDYSTIRSVLENLAYLNPEVKFTIQDLRGEDTIEDEFLFEEGISEFVLHLNEGKEALHEDIIRVRGEDITDQDEKVSVDIALQYTDSTNTSMYSFANNIETADGGTHETGFKTSLTRVINKYAEDNGLLSKIDGERLSGDIVREGLTAVISVKHSEPQFEGQTKAKLGNADARGVVSSKVTEHLGKFLEEHPDDATSIIDKAVEAYKAKQAAQKAEQLERKSATTSTRLPGKLADCQRGTSTDDAELFVVEGDSAGGCFTGDTKIALSSGRSITFEELVQEYEDGEKHYCYTVDNSGSIQLEEVTNPRRTEEDADLVQVTLDNNETIECTPDHEFMLRGGRYKEAQNLRSEDALMPLYKGANKVKDGSQNILTNSTTINKSSQDEARLEEAGSYNHQVTQVEELEKTADVYDIEVPGTHNFALESGVFVHNSAKQARDPEEQAILPLRGKILNVEKNRLNKILEHDQIQNLITALGTGIDDEFNLDDLRYHTIILFVDADVDGAHIKTLLLTFLFRHMPELLENGHVYAAKPPLYRIKYRGKTYDAMTDEERDKIVEEKCNGNPDNVQRFKGLGEMNPKQLWDTTMNPENRYLQRINVDDAAKADRIFSVLMGSKVEPRRNFIRENADEADWIDI